MSDSAYKIGKKLYEDLIGTVYSFSSEANKNTGQIKILHEEFAKQDDLVQAFHKCAEKSCSIRNQNTISALSHGEGNGTHYIVLETCNLTPLSILLKKTHVLSISDSIGVIETLANTLRQAHIDEVIHAHLSPQSIFTEINFKQVKIANFGFDELIRLLIKKKQGSLINTLPYYSPELIHGNKPLNRQSDIYPLGVLFYRFLVGELPWETYEADDYLRNPYRRALVPPSLQRLEIPALLDELVLEALEPNLENRCPTISQFIEKIAETKKEVLPIVTLSAEIFNDEVLHETVTQSNETAVNQGDYQKEKKITEPGTELQNKTPEAKIDNEKKDETLEAHEEVSSQPGIQSNSLEKESPPQFEKSQQTTSDSETKLAESETSQPDESPEKIPIPTERLEQKPVLESSQFSNENEAKNPDLGPIQEKNKTGQTTKEESPEITPEATVEPNERDSIPSLATSTPEPETGEAPVSPRIEPQERIPDNNEKETAPLPPQEEVPSQLMMDSNNLEKQTPAQLENLQEPPSEPTTADTTSAASPEPTTILPEDADQNPVSEDGQLSNIESESQIQDVEPVSEFDPATNDKHNSSAQDVDKEFTKSEQLHRNDFSAVPTPPLEEIDELASITPSELSENPPDDGDETTESTQLDKPGEARSAALTTLDEPQASQPENLSLEETPEQNAQNEFFDTVEENQEQNPVIQQQRDVEQNEQALKPEQENLWPNQENNFGESVVNQNQEDEIDQLVRSQDPRVPSSQLHTHENADPPKISQEPHQQTKVAAPFGSNGGQKTGVPFGSKDETIFSKSSPQTSRPPDFYKKQLHGRSSLTVIKTVLIALIPISVIYLLIVVTFDANFMNRLSSLKESFFIKKTESKNSSNSNPLTSYEPAEANQTNSDEIASTRPIISGKSGTSFQANLPPVSELKLQLSVRGSGLPQASDIFVSGAHYGKTNNQGRMLLSNLTVNQSYIIKVEKQGFEMWAKEVSFSTLGTKDLNVALKPLPSKALSNSGQKIGQSTVTILLSNPQNVSSATIYIDGKLWGGRDNIAPAKLQIPAGDHIVEVKQDGFRSHPASQSLTLAIGENRTIYFYLIPN